MEATMKTIEKMWIGASDLAIKLIKNEAREILIDDPDLDEFIMAMGSCFFTLKEGGKYDSNSYTDEEWEEYCESDEYVSSYYNNIGNDDNFQEKFFEMIDDLDEKFNVMGYPVRFTAKSKEVHDWGDTIKDPVKYEDLEGNDE